MLKGTTATEHSLGIQPVVISVFSVLYIYGNNKLKIIITIFNI